MDIDEYLKGILSQILASHKILTELDDDVCLGCDKLQYDYSRGDL